MTAPDELSPCIVDSAVGVRMNGGMYGDIVKHFERQLVRKALYAVPLTV